MCQTRSASADHRTRHVGTCSILGHESAITEARKLFFLKRGLRNEKV